MQDRYLTKLISILIFFIVSITFAGEPPIRFAWLSDTHLGSSTGVDDLREAVRDINSLDGIDFVVLSGDITEMGSNRELELAKTILDSLNKPYYIIPGNHDTKWSESGCTKFSELWGSDKFNFEFEGYRFIGMHQGPLMRMGDGHFAPEDLHWLDFQLAALPDKNQPIIFVTHYPLDSSIDNWYEVIDQLKPFNVKAVLCGHGHRNQALDFEGIPGVMGRSTLRRNQPHGGYHIVTLQNDSMFFSERLIGEIKESAIGMDSSEHQEFSAARRYAPCATLHPWHKLSLARRDFTTDSTTNDRPDFSINQKYPNVKINWKFETGFTIASTPAVWKDYVVVGNSGGTLYALSLKNGKKRWTFKTEKSIFSSPAIAEGKVIFGSSDKAIYCLDIKDGKLIWKYSTAEAVVATPRIENNIVYIGGSDGKFRALKLESGELLWEFDGIEGFVETSPLIYQQKIIFGAWDGCLYALNQSDGALAWKWNDGTPGNLFSPAACWPVAANDKIFIVAPDRFMTAIDSKTGQTLWRTNQHKVRESIGISENRQTIYARCMTDTLLAFDSYASMPDLVWTTPCGYGYDIDPSLPIEKDGVIFFGTKNGFLFAIDSKIRKVKFQFRIGVSVVNTVTPIDAHRVILTDMDGRVMLVETSD